MISAYPRIPIIDMVRMSVLLSTRVVGSASHLPADRGHSPPRRPQPTEARRAAQRHHRDDQPVGERAHGAQGPDASQDRRRPGRPRPRPVRCLTRTGSQRSPTAYGTATTAAAGSTTNTKQTATGPAAAHAGGNANPNPRRTWTGSPRPSVSPLSAATATRTRAGSADGRGLTEARDEPTRGGGR